MIENSKRRKYREISALQNCGLFTFGPPCICENKKVPDPILSFSHITYGRDKLYFFSWHYLLSDCKVGRKKKKKHFIDIQ